MNDPIDISLDNCGCCEPDPAPTPINNRPGLPALSYRVGTYATFLRRMIAELGRYSLPDGDFAETRPLLALTTRDQDDPSIALLDASSVVADVLTFYQERIANEGFLRTATERRSILELARAIGYELNPGVAASVYLAFTIEDAMGAPGVADIPAGTKVQSVPPQNQLPQTFETSLDIPARAAWNALLPRLSVPQDLTKGVSEIYLAGTATNLKVGDVILVTSTVNSGAGHVVAMEVDSTNKFTYVALEPAIAPVGAVPTSLGATALSGNQKIPFRADAIQQFILNATWEDSALNGFLKANDWDANELVDYLTNYRASTPATSGYAYALRSRLGIFGNNAPLYDSLPVSQRVGSWNYNGTTHTYDFDSPAYPNTWDDRYVETDSQGNVYPDADFFLERAVPSVQAGGYFALESKEVGLQGYSIAETIEKSLSDYGMSAKVTGITAGAFSSVSSYKTRTTTAYVQSELLPLIETPLSTNLAAGTTQLELNGFVFGLQIGQPVILSGERSDAKGLIQNEVLMIKDITHNYGLTTLIFDGGLTYSYLRQTVAINANVAPATHGETVTELLGNGNGAQSNQRFTLKRPPLTYTASPTPSGSASTLQLRVNNLLWGEAPSLYSLGPKDQQYIVRIDDNASATVLFGDGLKGARLPSGVNNVVATYRSGIGLAGEVEAGSLTILQSKPLGVRSVTNPLAASGAADPEKMADARGHAPLTVRTLDRIVSVDDYQDFASAFAGIGKAQAIDLWSGEHHLVFITIAGADGLPITDQKFLDNFNAALNAARDPAQLVKVDTFDQLLFDLSASVAVDSRYITKDVFTAIQTALVDAFSFARRGFGQSVSAAEIMTVIQNVPGVVFTDLVGLFLTKESPALNQVLTASTAYTDSMGNIQHAQLLLINPLGVTLQEVNS